MIELYDTTLRDGTQGKDISLSCNDKIAIARKLDELGVSYIEGGWPGSNPKDVEFFERAAKISWRNSRIAAFGSTCQANKTPAEDPNIQALLNSGAGTCTIFGKTSVLHVKEVLRTTLGNNLRMIEESVAYLREQKKSVIYDAEHFFDGFADDPEYALLTLKAAIKGGADRVVLCDTNGGNMPWQVGKTVQLVRSAVEIPLGIHAHNDGECAVANSLIAVQEGCSQVQGTINGYGERCGNANLCSIIPNLILKLGLQAIPAQNLTHLYELSHFVSEMANLSPNEHMAYVGKAAFTHKAGVHVAALRRNIRSYQHIEPELVGNKMEVIVSELSGKGNLLSIAEEHGLKVDEEESTKKVLNEVKKLESQGFSFEAAEASVIMLFKRGEKGYQPLFKLIDFATHVEHRQGRGIIAEATVKIDVGGDIMHTAAEGNGPVNALDLALRKALCGHYPSIDQFHLSDYKVRILDGKNGTCATTRVLIETQNGNKSWNTVGASSNIIEASWIALVDSMEYGIMVAR
ncbi:MAG: citramalate synthase [Chloroflexi bacterium]|nr:citramalate synthase [Chloroflexota bacterium]